MNSQRNLPTLGEVWEIFRKNFIYFVLNGLVSAILVSLGICGARLRFSLRALIEVSEFFALGIFQATLFIKVFHDCINKPIVLRESLSQGLRQVQPVLRTSLLILFGTFSGFLFFIIPGIYYLAAMAYALPLSIARISGISDTPMRSSFRLTKPHIAVLMLVNSLFIILILTGGWLGVRLTHSFPAHASPLVQMWISCVLGIPVYGLWMSFVCLACAHAVMELIPNMAGELPAVKPASTLLRGLFYFGISIAGFMFLFFLLLFGLGFWISSPAGGRNYYALLNKMWMNENVVIQGKTILVPPENWSSTYNKLISGPDGAAYDLKQMGTGFGKSTQIGVEWFPIPATKIILKEDADRIAQIIVQRISDARLAGAKRVSGRWHDSIEKYMKGWRVVELSPIQIAAKPAWMVTLRREDMCWRHRFLPLLDGIVVISDSYQDRDEALHEQAIRPVLEALTLP